MAEQELVLPNAAVSVVDVGRLYRELESIDDFLAQSKVRQPGATLRLPRTGQILEETTRLNKLNLLNAADRQQLATFLLSLKKQAPRLHISFAADPSATFVQKLLNWLRAEIHPHILLEIGLQPGLAAGCIVRTPNHQFDFSLRQRFEASRELLLEKIEGHVNER